jgi:hypothetical protein
MKAQKSISFTVSNTTVNSVREKIHSKLVHYQQLGELHASACDIAQSVNAVYSPILQLCVARSFTSHTHMFYITFSLVLLSRKQVSFVNQTQVALTLCG